MATFSSTAVQSNKYPKTVSNGGLFALSAKFSFTASSGDVVQMVKVPTGFTVRELVFARSSRRLGGGTANAVSTLSIGDDNLAGRFATGVSASVTAIQRVALGAGLNFAYTVNDTIDVTVTGITGTGSVSQTVTLNLSVIGDMGDATQG